jgi:hypothetical protein
VAQLITRLENGLLFYVTQNIRMRLFNLTIKIYTLFLIEIIFSFQNEQTLIVKTGIGL